MSKDIFRKVYKLLNSEEQTKIIELKNSAKVYYRLLDKINPSREISLAKTKLEESVFWATKHITS